MEVGTESYLDLSHLDSKAQHGCFFFRQSASGLRYLLSCLRKRRQNMASAIPHMVDSSKAPFPVRHCAQRIADMIVAILEAAPRKKRSEIRITITTKSVC